MKDIKINPSASIKEAMEFLDKTAEKCLLVTTEDNKLLGTITDGDLRRSILNGSQFSEKIESYFNTNPTILNLDDYNEEKGKNLLSAKNLTMIPVVDNDRNVVDFVTWSTLNENKKQINLDVPVIVMAGGEGKRLKPFTNVLPKPLIPIGDKTIIEHIIERFTKIGCKQFYLTVNYKSRVLKAYLEDLNSNYVTKFIEEKKPLGTAGSLHLMEGFLDKPFFVTNCDIIVKAEYENIYKFHLNGGYDLTLVASAKEYKIPYGTCELNKKGDLLRINEKPQHDYLINTGLYILNPEILDLIPKNKFFHITQLIEKIMKKNSKVGVYPVNDNAWIDVGQWNEYKKAREKLL